MAIIDLGSSTKAPDHYTQAGVGTTWQEWKAPGWATHASVQADAAIYVALLGSTTPTPTDGGAVGTHRWTQPANTDRSYAIGRAAGGPVHAGVTMSDRVFVAAQSGTATVSVMFESRGA